MARGDVTPAFGENITDYTVEQLYERRDMKVGSGYAAGEQQIDDEIAKRAKLWHARSGQSDG